MSEMTKQPEDVIQDTKKFIIDTARRFFSEYSYLGVSMNDIAKKLNITKAALYYHFSSKAEIYENVLNNVISDLNQVITEAKKETTIDKKIHKLIKNYLDFGFKEKNLIKALMSKLSPPNDKITSQIANLRGKIANIIQPLIDEALASKYLMKNISSQLFTSLLIGMMDGLVLEYSFLDKKIDSEKVSNQIIAVLF